MNFTHVGLPPEIKELTAEMIKGVRWYTTPEGIKYPSVTSVLSHGDKPWLRNWRNMLGENQADKETKRAADRGEAVHLMAERYLNNEDDPLKEQKIDHIKLFNQLKPHLNKINNIHAQEVPLYSDVLKVAGRVDCIGEYMGVLSIIDFKTSNNNKDEEMIQDYFKQCTAYSLMYEELTGIEIKQIVILMTVEKGLVPLKWIKERDGFIMPLYEKIQDFYKDLK